MGRKPAGRRPHFFKVLLKNYDRKLRIPPNFLKNIPKDSPRRVFLHGPGGDTWRVELEETSRETWLANGWPKFVKDHSIEMNDFLVFRYDGNMHFTVHIFDTTACEREDALAVTSSKEIIACPAQNKRGRPPKEVSDTSCFIPEKESRSKVSKHLDDGKQLMASNQPIINVFVKTEDTELPTLNIGYKAKKPSGFVSTRRPVTEEERDNAKMAANSFRSSYPYCILRMTEGHVSSKYSMRFPVKFSRQHLPRERTNLILRDPNGKAWVVVYVPNTRDRLSSGWFTFARGNNLEEGDYCIFELIGPTELRVYIFRVVDGTTPPPLPPPAPTPIELDP